MQLMMLRILSVFSLAFLVLTGCSSSATTSEPVTSESVAATPADTTTRSGPETTGELKTAIEYAQSLDNALAMYEKRRQEAQTALDGATQEALQTLSNDPTPAQVRQATSTWRQQWNEVQAQTKRLWMALGNVEAAATQYFTHLERQTAMIRDADLRETERNRNKTLQQTWTNAAMTAANNIRDLETHLQAGDDLYIAMLNASLRAGFDENVEQLQDVAETGRTLLGDLHGLTTTGEALMGGASDETDAPAASSGEASASSESGR